MAEALAGDHPPVRSLYIHTPFCSHKCHYCDFYSFVDTKDQQAAFMGRLIDELRALAPHAAGAPLRTIFIGGGTPSLLRVEHWQRLLAALSDLFDLSEIKQPRQFPSASPQPPIPSPPTAEFTVECNPESTSLDLLHCLRAGGVDRISMGAQSFTPRHLATLQRLHDPARVELALDLCKQAGIPRTSIDLIYAIPTQTLDEWSSDLDAALALVDRFAMSHLSCYNLVYEPNTQMTTRLARGEFTPIDEDLEAEMFSLTASRLAAHGLRRYEVSNYAKPGAESRHNLAYWFQEQWLAAGPSASGHLYASADPRHGGHRTKNIGNLTNYLASTGLSPLSDHERPDPARAVRERIMTGMRLATGLPLAETIEAAEAVRPGASAKLLTKAREFAGDGLVTIDTHLRVTDAGWLMADFVAKKLMACVE